MRTANIASALFVVGLLISGNLAGGGADLTNIVVTSAITSSSTALQAELYLTDLERSPVAAKTLRIAIDVKDGLKSHYAASRKGAKSSGANTRFSSFNTLQDSTTALCLVCQPFEASRTLDTVGEKWLDGQQVARSLFRYDFIKAPDIPSI